MEPSISPFSYFLAVPGQELRAGRAQPPAPLSWPHREKRGQSLLLESPSPVHARPAVGAVCSGGIVGCLSYSSHTHRYLILEGSVHILIYSLSCCPNGIKVSNCFISHGWSHDKYVKDRETFRYYSNRNNKKTYINCSVCVRIHRGFVHRKEPGKEEVFYEKFFPFFFALKWSVLWKYTMVAVLQQPEFVQCLH